MTIDRASLSKRSTVPSTVPTPNRDTSNMRAMETMGCMLSTMSVCVHEFVCVSTTRAFTHDLLYCVNDLGRVATVCEHVDDLGMFP